MSRYRRLPNGKMTLSEATYSRAWNRVAREAESFFPGYVVTAYNPDFRLTLWKEKTDGTSFALDQVNLTTTGINALKRSSAIRQGGAKRGVPRRNK